MAAFALLGAVLPAAAPAVAGALPAALGISASSSAFLAANGGKFAQFGLAFGSAFPTNVSQVIASERNSFLMTVLHPGRRRCD